jgi:hypothetical protein
MGAFQRRPARLDRGDRRARLRGGRRRLAREAAMTRTLVVTCPVPVSDLELLELNPHDHTIVITGPNGFRHDLELPEEADLDRLEVELYKHFLELRAPLK